MDIEFIRAPTEAFNQMLLNNIRPSDRKHLEDISWGAAGLIQARLIQLYWAADVAEKASNVRAVLVMGNCPQHIQMLAIVGQQGAVRAALDKIMEGVPQEKHHPRWNVKQNSPLHQLSPIRGRTGVDFYGIVNQERGVK